MTDALLAEFLASFDDSQYPSDFLEKYELLECLANNEIGETLLIKDRQTGEYFVAKCYIEESYLSKSPEGEVLKVLDHQGVPRYVGEYKNEKMLCVVRSFTEGKPLDRLVREKALSQSQSIQIAAQLCEILTYLHNQNPPVIHRDIKPQNIIADEDGKITLIDFGISRTFNESSREDTVCFGTRKYAAPEQYGFSQTDSRADIFSLGVLLLWLLTGSVEIQDVSKLIPNRRLAKIIAKCSAFAPNDRYKNAVQVRDALTGRSKRRKIIAMVVAVLLIISAAAFLFRPSGSLYQQITGIRFKEPLIEQAVRLTLDKTDNEQLTEQDLDSIESIFIFGDKAAGDADTFNIYANDFVYNGGNVLQGDITDLSDLKKLKNLRSISIDYQMIMDVSPLAGLSKLESVDLRHNPVEDISPLSGMPSLTNLCLFGTNVSDLTSLSTCPRLTMVDVGGTLVTSTSAFDGLNAMQSLVIRKAPLQSLENIESHEMLKTMYLSETQLLDLSPLLQLPNLQTVEVSQDMQSAVESLEGQNEFELVYQ